jgi:hypothetical protein
VGKKQKLKAARSQAELRALHQRWIQIALTSMVLLLNILIALKAFGII